MMAGLGHDETSHAQRLRSQTLHDCTWHFV
jgi:hypothetical protein